MSTSGIHWLSEAATCLSGKLVFFTDKPDYWLTGDMLFSSVCLLARLTRYVVISTWLFSLKVGFYVSFWLMSLSETIRAFINLVCAQINCSDSLNCSANKCGSNLNKLGHDNFWCLFIRVNTFSWTAQKYRCSRRFKCDFVGYVIENHDISRDYSLSKLASDEIDNRCCFDTVLSSTGTMSFNNGSLRCEYTFFP